MSGQEAQPACQVMSEAECKEVWRSADAVCFDVDSTVIQDEGVDQLATFCGRGDKVAEITKVAMQGGMDFRESLRARLNLLQPKLETICAFCRSYPPRLTKDVGPLVEELLERGVDVYLVSGGFRSLIAPVAKLLNIPLENIFANRLKFFYDGEYGGFDESQLTSRSFGKSEVMAHLKQREGYTRLVMVGDGITDLEAYPPADAFVGFGGNVVREVVKEKASWYVYNFQTLIEELNKDI